MVGDSPTIQVFTAPDCGRCPDALDVARRVADARDVPLERIDTAADRKKALQAGVLSVPTTVVGDVRIRGVPEAEAIERALEDHQ